MALKSKNLAIILSFLALLIISSSFLYFMGRRQGAGILIVETPTGTIKMEIAENNVNLTDFLNNLLKDDKYRNETLAILQQNFGLFKRDCSQLIDSFRREDGNSQLSNSLRELLYDLKGPFDRRYHHYYDITKKSVADAIQNLDYNHPVAIKFRELRDEAVGIFEDKGVKVEVLFCNFDEIEEGNAAVCRGSKYHGRYLLILNLNNRHKSIRVFARSTIPCINTEERETLIQLNQSDGKKLYGDINPDKKMKALLFIPPIGYDIIPYYLAQNIKIE